MLAGWGLNANHAAKRSWPMAHIQGQLQAVVPASKRPPEIGAPSSLSPLSFNGCASVHTTWEVAQACAGETRIAAACAWPASSPARCSARKAGYGLSLADKLDNAFVVALFRTRNTAPSSHPRGSPIWWLPDAQWYNHEQGHSGTCYLTRSGRDLRLLDTLQAVRGSATHVVGCWSGNTRKWSPLSVLTRNPEPGTYVQAAGAQIRLSDRTLGCCTSPPTGPDRWMRVGVCSAPLPIATLGRRSAVRPRRSGDRFTVAMFGLFISALVYAGAPLGIGTKEVLAATGLRAASGLVAAILGYMPQQSWLGDFLRLTRFVISVPICLTIYLAAVIGVLLVGGPLMLSFSCSGIIATFLVDQKRCLPVAEAVLKQSRLVVSRRCDWRPRSYFVLASARRRN
jgi:hypothetical protein